MGNGAIFKIWARRDAIEQVEYAKEIGPKVLRFFEKTFKAPYPLPKMDMIAIPDFSAGAMENWGNALTEPAHYASKSFQLLSFYF